jgi:hypothetical protein
MNIVFYNRDFTGTVPLNLDIQIERYSHAMIGGPDTATLKIRPTSDKWELTKLLRCPVEIYGEDGGLKWWGFVDRVVIPHGKIRVGLGLDELYNSVSVKHQSGTTSASLDTQSVGEYGTKEYFINLSNAPEADATAYRATYLEAHKYAVPELELSGGGDEIVMECYGWWKTLSWKYYTDPSTDPVENTTQITNMVTSCGQFIRGVVLHDLAGIATTPTRDGSNNALVYITELLNAGSVNARPMLAYVDKDRYLHVYERIVETAEYIMRDDGNLETLLGKIVQPENCVSAAWVSVKGVPDTLGGISVMRPFFIDRAEYVEEDVEGLFL